MQAAVDMPLNRGTRFYWTETFGEPGGPRWFVGYDEAGKVVHVEAPTFPEIGLALYREAVPEQNLDDETLLYFASAALARRGPWH